MRPRLILAVTLIALAITATVVSAVMYKILNPPHYDTPDSKLLAHGDHFGEFGGYFISTEWIGKFLDREPSGVLHVYLTSGNFDPDLRKEAEETFDRIYLHKSKPGQKVVIHDTHYSRSDLAAWNRLLIKNYPGPTLGVVSSGVSQRHNRLTYTTSNRDKVPEIMEHIQKVGVPTDAVIIRVGSPVELKVGPKH